MIDPKIFFGVFFVIVVIVLIVIFSKKKGGGGTKCVPTCVNVKCGYNGCGKTDTDRCPDTCLSGMSCNYSNSTCFPLGNNCESSEDCPSSQICNISSGSCVTPCTSTSCPTGYYCGSQGICIVNPSGGSCSDKNPCSEGNWCNEGKCVSQGWICTGNTKAPVPSSGKLPSGCEKQNCLIDEKTCFSTLDNCQGNGSVDLDGNPSECIWCPSPYTFGEDKRCYIYSPTVTGNTCANNPDLGNDPVNGNPIQTASEDGGNGTWCWTETNVPSGMWYWAGDNSNDDADCQRSMNGCWCQVPPSTEGTVTQEINSWFLPNSIDPRSAPTFSKAGEGPICGSNDPRRPGPPGSDQWCGKTPACH